MRARHRSLHRQILVVWSVEVKHAESATGRAIRISGY